MKKLTRGVLIVGTGLLFAGTGCTYEPRESDPCSTQYEQACDAKNVVYTCTDGQWVEQYQSSEYECDCIARDWNGCAVPGFVGIAEAGLSRTTPRLLRQRPTEPLPMLV